VGRLRESGSDPRLVPGRLVRLLDQLLFLLLEEDGESGRDVGRLSLKLALRILELGDQVIELHTDVVLGCHQVIEDAQVGVELIPNSVFAIQVRKAGIPLRLQFGEIAFEPGLQSMCMLARDNEIDGRHERLAQATRPGNNLEQRGWLAVCGSCDCPHLSAFDIDAVLCVLDLGVELSNLILEGGDAILLRSDLVCQPLFAGGSPVERCAELLLRCQRPGEIAAEACA
jgi:hypothetical protein